MTGFKHGFARPDSRDPAYRSWESAKARCRNPNNPDYATYGGRGIVFDARWDSFPAFLADMGPRPRGTTLDRINSDGDYAPGNCRWASNEDQARNKRSNRRVLFDGRTMTLVELSLATRQPYQRLHERIVRRGWAVERAVHEKPRTWNAAIEVARKELAP